MWAGGLASVVTAVAVLAVRSHRRHVRVRLHAHPSPYLLVTEPHRPPVRIG
jgi:hypothetical protein